MTWRCFHCDETFTDYYVALRHFGYNEREAPFCRRSTANPILSSEASVRYNVHWYNHKSLKGGVWQAIELPEVLHRVELHAGPNVDIDVRVYSPAED